MHFDEHVEGIDAEYGGGGGGGKHGASVARRARTTVIRIRHAVSYDRMPAAGLPDRCVSGRFVAANAQQQNLESDRNERKRSLNLRRC